MLPLQRYTFSCSSLQQAKQEEHFKQVSESAHALNKDAEQGQSRHSLMEEEQSKESEKFGKELEEKEKAAEMRRAESLEGIVEKQAHLQGED